MEELFAILLSGVAEIVIEVLFQVAIEIIVALVERSVRNVSSASHAISPILAALGYLLLGVVSGVVSVLLFPHPFVHPSKIHGISLVVSPVVTGLVMSQVGALLRRKGKKTVRIESFAYGFMFALGLVIIRLAYVR
jgi:hypothetical protein